MTPPPLVMRYTDDLNAHTVDVPEMKTYELRVHTSVGTDDLTPTSGKRIRVHGILASATVTTALTSSLRATCAFGTDHTSDATKILASHRCTKGEDSHCCWISPINVLGEVDEVVRLTNGTYTNGNVIYRAVVYYTEE